MIPPTHDSHVQQLAELLVQLAHAGDDEEVLLERGLLAVTEAAEAEVAAIVDAGRVCASIGFERGAVPTDAICELAAGQGQVLELDGAFLQVSVTRLDGDAKIVLARRGAPFTPADNALTHAMASALALSRRSARLVGRERAARRHSDRQAQEAQRDDLTGLPKRSVFFEHLAEATARARSCGRELAVLFMDLDGFKHVNDTLGHGVGDEVLLAVARRLRNVVRSEDVVARLGGDEFGVLIEDLHRPADAEAVATHISDALGAPFSAGGRTVSVRASIGIATGPHPTEDPQLLLRDADVAMYRAKADRPGGFVVFDQAMKDQAVARAGLAEDLRHAVCARQLHMAYQPVVELTTGRTAGFESLLRWQHPQRGAVAPSTFVPLAEELGLVFELGDWALAESCRQMATFRRRGLKDLTVAVNVSSHQLHDQGFADRVRRILAEHQVPSDRLVLEITETAALSEAAVVFDQLEVLASLGVLIALDDFGTGYSSLSHLTRLPIAILKVDRSFVRQVLTSDRHAALTESIVKLGRRLELAVVAEGIEDAEQLAALAAMGCPYGQGYLLGRPGSAERIIRARGASSPSRCSSGRHAGPGALLPGDAVASPDPGAPAHVTA